MTSPSLVDTCGLASVLVIAYGLHLAYAPLAWLWIGGVLLFVAAACAAEEKKKPK